MKKLISCFICIVLILGIMPLSTLPALAYTSGVWEYSVYDDEATIIGYSGPGDELIIPDKLGGYPVTRINGSFFEYGMPGSIFKDCTSITIPDNVKYIGGYSFYGCSKLTTVSIGRDFSSVGYMAFAGCDSLKRVNIVDLASWCQVSFEDATANPVGYAESLYVDGNLLTELVVPDGVTFIGDYAFYGCKSLSSVIISDSVISINSCAFMNCSGLENIIIGKNVKTIEGVAFWNCERLKNVTIPYSIESIGTSAFDYDEKLTDIYYIGGPKQWNNILIDNDCFGKGNNLLNSITIHFYSLNVSQEKVRFYTENYYNCPNTRLFRISAMGSSYPSPAGFIIDVGGNQYSSGQNTCVGTDDVTANVPFGYDGNVTISKDGFHTFSIPAKMTGQYNVITMVPSCVTNPFAQMLLLDKTQGANASYRNLLFENEIMYENDYFHSNPKQILRLYPSVDWNGHGEGIVWLEQGDIRVDLTNNTVNEIDWSEYFFEANREVYLCALAGDGTSVCTSTGLKVYKKLNSGIGLQFGDSLEINPEESTKGDISILSDSGEKISIDLKSLSDGLVPISVTVKADGTIEGVIGITLAQGKDTAAVFGPMKESMDRLASETTTEQSKEITSLLKEMKQNGTPIEQASSFGVKGSVQVIGYFTGNLFDGEVRLTESKIALVFSGALSYTYNTVVAGVPAYFKSSLSAKIETYLKMTYDELLQRMVADDNQSLKAALSLTAEVGPGWEGYLSGGVKGKGSVKLSTLIPLSKEDTLFSLQASFSFVGTIFGIEGEWQFYETPEKIFWDGSEPGYWCWKNKDSTTAPSLYFYPNLNATLMSMSGTGDTIATGISGFNTPALASLADGRLLSIWVADVQGRSLIDKGGLFYSIYENGTWSEAALIYDDGTNDSLPYLYEQNGIIYIAWQNYTTIFNRDTIPDFNTIATQVSYITATFDESTSTWGTPTTITEASFTKITEVDLPVDYEGEWPATMSMRQVLDNGIIRAVLYSTIADNEKEQVFGLFNDGFGWGEPVQLTNENRGVNGFNAVFNSDSISVLYTTGDYANSELKLHKVDTSADLVMNDADYIHQTLAPGNELTISATIKNDSPVTVNGVHISILNGEDTVHEEDFAVRFNSGEEDVLFINFLLPEVIGFSNLKVVAVPMMDEDADQSDNSAICKLYLTDLSVENTAATCVNGTTEVLSQVVNRGQTATQATTLTIHRGAPDGAIVGIEPVPTLQPGELETIVISLNGLSPGDMIYVEAAQFANENLISNNTAQAVILDSEGSDLSISASSVVNGGELSVRISINNKTTMSVDNLILVVATYDSNGKQMNVCCYENISIYALNSVEKKATFVLGNDIFGASWKAFLLDDSFCPIVNALAGEVTRA